MKLHDLRPPEGSHATRTRVGRGIAAGKGKTAGRGTKGQKARAGGSIPPWFEGGQTPLHMRIPKLRGFKNRGKIDYEIVNVGDISLRAEAGAFSAAENAPAKGEQLTINADILRAVGLVRDVRKPLKILGGGELTTALFVVADAFSKSATSKIESAGGSVNVLEVPAESRPALGLDGAAGDDAAAGDEAATTRTPGRSKKATTHAPADTSGPADDATVAEAGEPPRAKRAKAPRAEAPAATTAEASSEEAAPEVAAVADATADAPDAVAESGPEEAVAGEEPVTGDDSEPATVVPGDDA